MEALSIVRPHGTPLYFFAKNDTMPKKSYHQGGEGMYMEELRLRNYRNYTEER